MYVYQAVRRKKDNPQMTTQEKKIWEIDYCDGRTEEQICEKLKSKAKAPGFWRIYRSVNIRDEVKAKLDLINIVTRSLVYENNRSIESIWLSCLMTPANAAERLFLLDVDTKDLETVQNIRTLVDEDLLYEVETPNGWHIVTLPFNPKKLETIPFQNELSQVEIKRDAFVLVDTFTVTCDTNANHKTTT